MRWVSATILLPAALIVALLAGQTPPVFRVPVRVVEVPVAVTGSDGKIVRGLAVDDFTLFDNERLQRFRMEEAGQAFSAAIAIQNNASVRAWMPEVRGSASAIEALPLGSAGEAAILTFNDDVTVEQEMTSDVPHLDKAFHSLPIAGGKSRCLDAVAKAAEMLALSPPGRRRVLLLIAQQGDYGSKALFRDAVSEVERKNITSILPHDAARRKGPSGQRSSQWTRVVRWPGYRIYRFSRPD
jgi:hypothetical protein